MSTTIRIYNHIKLYAETSRGAGAALEHGAAILAHGGTPHFFAVDGDTERRLDMTAAASDHNRRFCRECGAR